MRLLADLTPRPTTPRTASAASSARHSSACVTSPSRCNHQRSAADAGAAVKCAAVFKFCRLQVPGRHAQLSDCSRVTLHCTASHLLVKPAPRLQLHLRQPLLSTMRHGARVRARCRQRGTHLQVTTPAKLLHLQPLITHTTVQFTCSQLHARLASSLQHSTPQLALTCSPLNNPFAASSACTVHRHVTHTHTNTPHVGSTYPTAYVPEAA